MDILEPSIPMSSPDLGEDERHAVMEVLNSPDLSMGPWIKKFEKSFCQLTGSRHAIAVNSGTAGLHLCIRAAGISSGDYVITTPFSFVASSNVILFENAIPVFVDVEADTGNIDPNLVEEAVHDLVAGGDRVQNWLPRKGADTGHSLKAILPVDVFGQPADLDPILAVSRHNHLKVIEDSCEALGAQHDHKPAGTFGDYGVFAFYPNKQITTGEGGVIITDDEDAAELMRALRNQGRAVGDTWLQHTHLGYNYRLDEMSAALGSVQLSRLDELMAKRDQVAAWYSERMAEIPWVETQVIKPFTSRMSWFVYVIRIAPQYDRDLVAAYMTRLGIPVRPYFSPIHLQPYMVERFGYQPGDFPVTEDLGNRSLALPFSGVMSEAQVDSVCRKIRSSL
jgi:perosamine synthetase